MGHGSFTDTDWSSYSRSVKDKPVYETFSSRKMKTTSDPRTSFDPKTIAAREARDSDDHPHSTPVILAFDVTGSMGEIPHYFVKEGLGVLMKEIFDRQPVSDPQIMCMAVGDVHFDRAPLQATQFESDIRIAEQLQDLYLEGGGGPNAFESYNLPWYFAALKTSTDALEKRGKKGLLFTIGDEPPAMKLEKEYAKEFLGIDSQRDLTSAEILDMVRRQYDVFHIVVEQGAGFRHYGEKMVAEWNELLGQGHVLRLSDYTKLSEVVTSAIQINEGADHDAVVSSWSGSTALVVAKAIGKVPAKGGKRSGPTGGGGPIKFAAPMVA